MNRTIKTVLAIALLGLGFAACKKDKAGSGGTANIKVAQMSPNAGSVDIKINDALLVGGVGYGTAAGYTSSASGSINFKVLPAGSSTPVFNANTAVTANKYYSFYLYDSVAGLKVSVIEDDRTPPPSGKANVRFLNLVHDGPTVDIVISGTPVKLFTFRSYQDHINNGAFTAYTATDPGTFTCAAVIPGTSVSISQLPDFNIVAGKRYTLVLRGFNGALGTTPEYVKLVPVEDL